ESTPAELVASINEFSPPLLYGWVTPLRQLAEHVRDHGGLKHQPRTIVTTAEALDSVTRRLLHEQLGGAVFQIYGVTEMGAMAWECAGCIGVQGTGKGDQAVESGVRGQGSSVGDEFSHGARIVDSRLP